MGSNNCIALFYEYDRTPVVRDSKHHRKKSREKKKKINQDRDIFYNSSSQQSFYFSPDLSFDYNVYILY